MTVHEAFPFLLLFTWKASILLVLALLCLRLLQKSNASTRHAVCAVAFCGILLLPLLMLTLPGFEIAPAAEIWVKIQTTASSAASVVNAQFGERISMLLLMGWAAGVMLLLLRCATGRMALWRLTARSKMLDTALWRDSIAQTAREFDRGWFHAPSIRAAKVTVPLACGVLRPTVLLPEKMEQWDALRRRTVLLHELAHIRRKDCLWQYVAQIAGAVLWFHPLVWILQARLRREEELACDDAVLAAGIEASQYADVLLNTAQSLHSPSLLACCMSGPGGADIRVRFSHLLDSSRDHRVQTRSAKWLAQIMVPFVLAMSFANATTPKLYKIGGDVSAPRLISKKEPEYTAAAKKAKIEGTVLLSVVIGKNGVVQKVTVTRSLDPGLDQKAMEAIRSWRFSPAMRKGKPVAVEAAVEVNFRLL